MRVTCEKKSRRDKNQCVKDNIFVRSNKTGLLHSHHSAVWQQCTDKIIRFAHIPVRSQRKRERKRNIQNDGKKQEGPCEQRKQGYSRMVANEMRKKKEKLARGFDDRSENFFLQMEEGQAGEVNAQRSMPRSESSAVTSKHTRCLAIQGTFTKHAHTSIHTSTDTDTR